jgi:hypothetical protein
MLNTVRSEICGTLAGLTLAASAHPDVSLVSALYEELVPVPDLPESLRAALRQCLAELAQSLPDEQIGCLKIADDLANSLVERLAIYRAALTKMRGDTLWLHFSAARYLLALSESGQPEAKAPCLMHSMLALDQSPPENPAPYMRQLIGHIALPFAPREAIRNASIAIQGGQSFAMDEIRAAGKQLGLIPQDQWVEQSISLLVRLEKACFLPSSTSQALVTAATAAGAETGIVIEESGTVVPPPLGDDFYFMFRDAGQRFWLPSIGITALRNGIISVDLTQLGRTQFYVFDQDGACVEDCSWGTQPFIADKVEAVEGALCIIGDRFMGPMNVCHFLLDHLTRVALYDRYLPDSQILLAEPFDTYKAMMARAGLQSRLLVKNVKRFSIRAETLLASSNLVANYRHPGHLCAPWALDFLRERFGIDTVRRGRRRRIFISRTDSKARQILNWPEIEPVLAKHGYEVLTLADMSLSEQIAAFAAAECVAGVHGAGLTNVLFSPPGLKVLEILPQMVASAAYWFLCHGAGHEYHAMVATDPEFPMPDHSTWTHQVQYNDRDVIIDPVRLAGFLAQMETGLKTADDEPRRDKVRPYRR